MKYVLIIISLLIPHLKGVAQSQEHNKIFQAKVDSINVAVREVDTYLPIHLAKKGMEWAKRVQQDSMYAVFCYMTGHLYLGKFVTDSALIFLQQAIKHSESGSFKIIQTKSQLDVINLYQTIDIDLVKAQDWISRTKSLIADLPDDRIRYTYVLAAWEKYLGRQKALLYDIDSAAYYYLRAIRIAKDGKDVDSEASYLVSLGNLLTDVGRSREGIVYYRQASQLYQKIGMMEPNSVIFYNIGNAFINLTQFDSALIYIDQAIAVAKTYNNPMIRARASIAMAQITIAESSNSNDKTEKVEKGLRDAIDLAKTHHLNEVEANACAYLGKLFSRKKNYDSAEFYLIRALYLSQEIREKLAVLSTLTYLSELYEEMDDSGKAYKYRTLESTYKDSVYQDDILRTTSELEARFQNQTKQSEIDKLNATNRYIVISHQKQQIIYWSVAAFLFMLILIAIGLYYYRNKQRLYKKETELRDLRYQIVQTRQTALRAQMNPHFIFNCMTAVDCYILNNEKQTASELLTYFADLIRSILEHSDREMVSLHEEVDSLELYLKVEQLRLSNSFDYSIMFNDQIDFDIPPLLLQPYVENAIIHGISLLENTRGKIDIVVSSFSEGELSITIRDNGIGLTKSRTINARNRSHHRSMGTRITQERIDLLRILHGYEINVFISDRLEMGSEHGTEVSIRISHINHEANVLLA